MSNDRRQGWHSSASNPNCNHSQFGRNTNIDSHGHNSRHGGHSCHEEDGWGRSLHRDGMMRSDHCDRYSSSDQRSTYTNNKNPKSYSGGNSHSKYAYQGSERHYNGGGYGRHESNPERYGNRKRYELPAITSAAGVTDEDVKRNTHPSKKPNLQQYCNGQDLSPEQKEFRAKVESQLQDGERIEYMDKQVFILPERWHEKKTRAAQIAIACVQRELKKNANQAKNGYSDYCDSSDSDVSYVGNKPKPDTLTASEIAFFEALPECLLMMVGFHIDDKIRDDADKICLCPCSRQNENWRKQQGIAIDEYDVCKTFKVCEPLGLMSHLKKVGGVFVEKENRKMRQVPMLCKFHYGAYEFLRELFKDYNGAIGHKALYHLNDANYKKAECAAVYRGKEEKQALFNENVQLKREVNTTEQKMMDLKKINIVLYEKSKRLESEMKKLGIVKKEKPQLTAKEMQLWHDTIDGHFASLRYIVDNGRKLEPIIKPMSIFVEPDPTGKCSFLLQPWLDGLYDGEQKASLFNKNDFEICRKVMFDDIPTHSEREELLAKKEAGEKPIPTSTEMFDISIALTSMWNVTFTKTQKCSKRRKMQNNLDTAVDKGGPSRQFLSDAWNQMQTLAVPVLFDKVHIFKHGITKEKRGAVLELIPLQDDYLIHQVEKIAVEKFHHKDSPAVKAEVQKAKTRIYKYSRVMGRFLLHAFIRGYPVSSAVMTPFYMNLMLRGIMPGDPRYEQSDVLDHIDGILAENGNKLLSDWKDDGLDKNGQPWETDTLISERLPDEFIKTCSLVLGGLMDGLSLHGRREASANLERGSELSNILHPVPLEAISKILFARPDLTFEDVKEALHPVYCKFDLWKGREDVLASYEALQKEFYEKQFLSYIKDEAQKDCKFLSKFVECCTGSCCLPYFAPGQINVEFNLDRGILALISFHTCTKDLVLPGKIYSCDEDNFRGMMNAVLKSCVNNFDMK